VKLLWAALLTATIACGGSAPTAVSPVPSPVPSAADPPAADGCVRTSTGMEPLIDLRGAYKGETGGLYGNGSNAVPGGHAEAGLTLARGVVPRDAAGLPSASGRYVFISIGMSNATQEFSTFKPIADGDPQKHPQLVIVDGAQGGVTADEWASPSCPCWSLLDQRLAADGVTPRQVATAWIKLANSNPTQPFPAHADLLRDDAIATIRNAETRYPNLRLAYLSSRIYAGYATSTLNPEPYAYESGFAVRSVIAAQLSGDARLRFDGATPAAPWVAWGPYLWADGLRPRSDGLTWSCSDFQSDGTHPSDSGRRKVAQMLLSFLKTDATARIWFLRP
jgi:hypothetical protein